MTDQGEPSPRADLLRSAMCLLEEHGHEGLSVRRVAERAGLSSGAPYYHFVDRRALLLALASAGFDALDEVARSVINETDVDARTMLHDLASAFLDFGAAHPRLIDLMYESELTRPIDAALEPFYRRAFDMVVAVVRKANPALSGPQSMIHAVSFWTALFGLARVLRQGMLDPFASPASGWRAAVLDHLVATVMKT